MAGAQRGVYSGWTRLGSRNGAEAVPAPAERTNHVMSRERRSLFLTEEVTAEPGRFGCPMLVRAHCGPLRGRAEPVYRCSLGWALHGEDEVVLCRATDAVPDCWKAHPERLEALATAEEASLQEAAPTALSAD